MMLRIRNLSGGISLSLLFRIAVTVALCFVVFLGLVITHILDKNVEGPATVMEAGFLASLGDTLVREMAFFPTAAPGAATAYAELVVWIAASVIMSTHQEYCPPISFLYVVFL